MKPGGDSGGQCFAGLGEDEAEEVPEPLLVGAGAALLGEDEEYEGHCVLGIGEEETVLAGQFVDFEGNDFDRWAEGVHDHLEELSVRARHCFFRGLF